MKQPKKPTRNQKEIISNNMLMVKNWFVIGETDFYLHVINVITGTKKMITKFPKKICAPATNHKAHIS